MAAGPLEAEHAVFACGPPPLGSARSRCTPVLTDTHGSPGRSLAVFTLCETLSPYDTSEAGAAFKCARLVGFGCRKYARRAGCGDLSVRLFCPWRSMVLLRWRLHTVTRLVQGCCAPAWRCLTTCELLVGRLDFASAGLLPMPPVRPRSDPGKTCRSNARFVEQAESVALSGLSIACHLAYPDGCP